MKFSFLARLVLLALAFQFVFAGGGCDSSGTGQQGTTSFPIHLINNTPMPATFTFPGSSGGVPVAGNGGTVNRAASVPDSHNGSDLSLRVSVANANNETDVKTISITPGDINAHVEVTATWDADVLTLTKHTL